MVMSLRTSSAVVFSLISLEAHPVDWEVLEPSSSALQTDARVSLGANTGVKATSPCEGIRLEAVGWSVEAIASRSSSLRPTVSGLRPDQGTKKPDVI